MLQVRLFKKTGGSGLTRSINITAAAAALQALENIFPGKGGVGQPTRE